MAKENSTNSSLFHGGAGYESPEESGWTIYFEDFINTNNHPAHHPTNSFSSSHDQTYTVADAVSSVADYELPGDYDAAAVDPGFSCKDHIIFSKRRKMIKELLVDDEALEDTASSPVNSPKVSDSTYFSKNQKHKENMIITPQVNKRREMGFVGIGSEYTELKKKGLCLVPLSMVVNYMAE